MNVAQSFENQMLEVGRRQKISDIEFLRGIAIAFTLIAHLFYAFPDATPVNAFLGRHSFGSGVDLFFVISGYVITTSLTADASRLWSAYRRRGLRLMSRVTDDSRAYLASVGKTLAAFWVRRAFRLFPSAFATIFLTMLFIGFFAPRTSGWTLGGFWLHAEAALAAFLQLFNVWYWRQVASGGNAVLFGAFWSLSLEEQFYLVFPIMMLAFGSLRRVGAVSAIIIAALFFLPKNTPYDAMWWFRVDGLFWGVLIACARPRLGFLARLSRINQLSIAGSLLLLCCFGLTETTIRLSEQNYAGGLMLVFAAILVLISSQDLNLFQFPVFGVFFVKLGERSYIIYLLHILIYSTIVIVGDAVNLITLSRPLAIIAQVLVIISSYFVTEFFHRNVELKYRALGRNLSTKILSPAT